MTKDNPFPGMNPFLQAFWPDVHTKLIAYIADAIADQLPRGLKARSEETVLLASQEEVPGRAYRADVAVLESWKQGIPPQWQPEHDHVESDLVATEPIYCIVDEQTDRWIEISDPNGHIITVIEVLSPANKDSAREKYWAKRHSYISGGISVVEIDLLRGGYHVVNIPQFVLEDKTAPYITCVTRATNPSCKEYYQSPLQARLPNLRIPLRPQDPDAVLALQPLVDRCYRMGGYWNEPHTYLPGPPLSAGEAAWVASRLQAAGFPGPTLA